jgi:hypothetical protein
VEVQLFFVVVLIKEDLIKGKQYNFAINGPARYSVQLGVY